MGGEKGVGDKLKQAESPRVAVGNTGHAASTFRHQKKLDVVVQSRWSGQSPAGAYREPSGHAQVDDQRPAAVEMGKHVLALSLHVCDRLARQAAGEIDRQGPAEVTAAYHHAIDSAAPEDWLQAAPYGLDFREFWHGIVFR